jgi:hypothetical protein
VQVLGFRDGKASDRWGSTAAQSSLGVHAGSPPNEERHVQERDVFDFFASTVSAIETFCFGVYGICALEDPANFTRTPRQITRTTLQQDVENHYGGTSFATSIVTLVTDPTLVEVVLTRNVLLHRVAPGRLVEMGSGRVTWRDLDPDLPDIDLGAAFIAERRAWLGRALAPAVRATAVFVETHFPTT